MKRILPVVLALAILFPALLLPAAAAEPEEFVFDHYEIPVVYNDFDFSFNENFQYFIYDGLLPEGFYTLSVTSTVLESQGFRCYVPGIHSLDYGNFESPFGSTLGTVMFLNLIVEAVNGSSFSYTADCEVFTAPDGSGSGYSFFGIRPAEGLDSTLIDSVIFSSYSESGYLNSFMDSMKTGFNSFNSLNLFHVFLASFGIVSSPVILWFGFRYVKVKVKKSFMKGKI